MKARNKIIIILIILGIGLFAVVQGLIKPQIARSEQQYIDEQSNPLTHDIGNVLKYKNKYMGNFSNLANLFNSLPLNQIGRTYQLNPDEFTAQINYKDTADSIEAIQVVQALIYDATAAFALIDNLKGISFNFMDVSYHVTRDDVEIWYGVKLSTLLDPDTWKTQAQEKLADEEYVVKCSKAILRYERYGA